MKEIIKQSKKKEVSEKKNVVIPYVAGLLEAITKAGIKVGIRTAFSASDTLKNRLNHVKTKILHEKGT